jgi:hypothetical protein
MNTAFVVAKGRHPFLGLFVQKKRDVTSVTSCSNSELGFLIERRITIRSSLSRELDWLVCESNCFLVKSLNHNILPD